MTVCRNVQNTMSEFFSPITHIPPPGGPFRHQMIDSIDMLKQIGKIRYNLVVIDRFSRWTEATQEATEFLCREVFPWFGLPEN